MSHPLFLYGTFLDQGSQSHLLQRSRRHPGWVQGELYRLRAGYPAMRPGGDGKVFGEWIDPIPDAVLQMLDLYKGVGQGLYERRLVEVHSGGIHFAAWAWVMEHPEDHGGRTIRSGRWHPHPRGADR